MSWKPPPKPPLRGSFRTHCFECGATDTPKWRFGQTLCNACGLKRKTQQARGWALPLPAAVTGGAPKRGRPLKASLDHQVYEAPELASWPRPAGAPVHATSVAPPQPHDGTDGGEHSHPWTDGPGNPPAQAQRHATAPQPSEERVMVVESSCLQCSVPLRLPVEQLQNATVPVNRMQCGQCGHVMSIEWTPPVQ